MIEKITPAGITKIDNQIRNRTETTAVSSSETETASESSSSQKVSTAKKYNSIYLKARDSQSNLSYVQSRADALKAVSVKLQQLKKMAVEYDSAKDRSLAEQDTIVANAEQVLTSIDTMASKEQFLGSKVIGDADSKELGLDVINLESGGAQAQLDRAIRQVSAKLASNSALNAETEIRLENLEKTSKLKNGYLTEFQASEIVDSLVNAMGETDPEDLYKKLDAGKTSGLIF
ncbi:MAG: hypothetical protein AB7E96_10205 [Deferribacterales bacterium]